MATVFNQDTRTLRLDGPSKELVLTAFSGREEVSRPFQFQLEMFSENLDIDPKAIVGQKVTFSVMRSDQTFRHFHGHVSRFAAGEEKDGRRSYRAEVVPWLWFLTRTSDCRIFQNKTLPEIIKQVFDDLGFNDYKMNLVEKHPAWEYCVQYRETDFNFVSRLMEQEGIFYYFKHDKGKHTLVLGDHKGAYYDCVEKTVDFPPDLGTRIIKDCLTSWEHTWEFGSGKWAQTDYYFETPSTSLLTETESIGTIPGIKKYELFDFPGEYEKKDDGKADTRIRMEEVEAGFDVAAGSSYCKTFAPGAKFSIGSHRSASEQGKSYMITAITHSARELQAYETGGGSAGGTDYQNHFSCIPDSVAFRPVRLTPKPVVNGLQTAVVVGPSGEEIFVDKYGRVKVQFFWDRQGKKNETSSCWIRVSQTNAENSFGAMHIPRIGAEVVVSFLEGDPDHPLIVGRVYHAENMPPYSLPDSKTISGIKSKTYKGSGYNEYIMDDSPGKELIREHGQFDKDSTIEHDLREHVLHDRSRDVTNNETIEIGNDRSETVGHDETLAVGNNRTESVGVDEALSVGANRTRQVGGNENVTINVTRTHVVGVNESITIGAAQEILVGGARTVNIGASQKISVGANQTLTIGSNLKESVGKDRQESVGGERKSKIGKNDTLSVGKKLMIKAGDEIVLKTGQASITMKKNGDIVIKGKDVKIEAMKKVQSKGMEVSSEASTTNVTKGTMVTVQASAINTIKGSLVKIN